jgi:hypothetical protein
MYMQSEGKKKSGKTTRQVEKCCGKGCKHVGNKPLAGSSHESRRMEAISERGRDSL